MKIAILFAVTLFFVSTSLFANSASMDGDSVVSRTETVPWTSQSNSSGLVAYKQVLNAAQPDAYAVLNGEDATPLFEKAVLLIQSTQGRNFATNEEAALAIISELSK